MGQPGGISLPLIMQQVKPFSFHTSRGQKRLGQGNTRGKHFGHMNILLLSLCLHNGCRLQAVLLLGVLAGPPHEGMHSKLQ